MKYYLALLFLAFQTPAMAENFLSELGKNPTGIATDENPNSAAPSLPSLKGSMGSGMKPAGLPAIGDEVKLKELLYRGYRETARNLCLERARQQDILPENSKSAVDSHIGIKKVPTPPLFQRNECAHNFERDRCENLFISSMKNEKQALYSSKIFDSSGDLDLSILNEIAHVLDRPHLNLKLTNKMSPTESLKEVTKEIVQPKELKDGRAKDDAASILGQPSILALTQTIVQALDEALARKDLRKRDELMQVLNKVNPSAAKSLRCLLDQLPLDMGDAKLTEMEKMIGPISGHDYKQKSDTEIRGGYFSDLVAIVGLTIVWIQYREAQADKEARAAKEAESEKRAKAAEERDIQRFAWEKEEHEKKTGKDKTTPDKSPEENTSGVTHEDPETESAPDLFAPMLSETGIGGAGGELASPDAQENMARLHEIREKMASIKASEEDSSSHFDESQIDDFCLKTLEDFKREQEKSFSISTEIDPDLMPSNDTSFAKVIEFDKWAPTDRPASQDLSKENSPVNKNCPVKDAVGF